jgi:hypothetical protein
MKPDSQRTDDPTRFSGSQVRHQYGPYRILSLLGAGGMARCIGCTTTGLAAMLPSRVSSA